MSVIPRTAVILAIAVALAAGCSNNAEKFIESARKHQSEGRDRAAAIELKNALSIEPESPAANFMLGRLLMKVGNPADAELVLTKALRVGHPPEVVLPLLAEAQIERERYSVALETLQTQAQLDRAAQARFAILRGRAYLGTGSLLEARTQFQLAKEDLPVDSRLGLAGLTLAGNDRTGALREVDAIISDHPKSADTWLFRGEILRLDGKNEEAISAYRQAAKLDPSSAAALAAEANLLLGREEIDAAKALIERAEKISPLKPILEFARGLLAFKENRFDDARVALQRLLEAIPDYGPALLLAGSLDFSTEQYDLAQNAFSAYLARDPGNLYARKMLAATLLAKEQPGSALKALQPVLETGHDAHVLALASRANLSAGRFQQAIEFQRRAVELAPKDAEMRTNLGLANFAAGRRAQAVADLEAAIALGPKTARADHTLTMMLVADKKLRDAERVVQQLERRLPGNPEAPMLHGVIKLAEKIDGAARKSFEQALKLDPAHLPAAEALADIDRRAGKPDALRQRLETILAQSPGNVDALLRLARLDLEEGRGEQGIARARQALGAQPRSLAALLTLARLQIGAGSNKEAMNSARRAIAEHPWDSRAVELLADAQFLEGDIPGAIVTLTKLAEMRPRQAGPHVRIAAANVETGDLRSAISRLQGALRIERGSIPARLMLGEVYIRLKRLEEARELASNIQKNAPNSAAGYRLEGDVWSAMGEFARAAKLFEKAEKLQPSGELRVRLHRAQSLTAGRMASPQLLHEWLNERPSDNPTRLYLADSYADAGKYREAAEQYKELAKRAPDDFRVHNNLAWALHNLGEPQALEHAERAAKLRPEDPRVLDTLGIILLDRQRGAEAIQLLLKAAELAPDDPGIRYHLVKALVSVGDADRARKELKNILARGKPFPNQHEAQKLLAKLESAAR